MQPTLLYSSFHFYGGEAHVSYRRHGKARTALEGLAHVSEILLEPLAMAIPDQRSYKESSRLCELASCITKHAEVLAARPQ